MKIFEELRRLFTAGKEAQLQECSSVRQQGKELWHLLPQVVEVSRLPFTETETELRGWSFFGQFGKVLGLENDATSLRVHFDSELGASLALLVG